MRAVPVALVIAGAGCLIAAGFLLSTWVGFAVAGGLGLTAGLLIDDGSGDAPD